jgi:hypothetical protein
MFDWLKRKKPLNEVAILNENKDANLRTMVLTQDIKIQTRRAQNVAPEYAAAIRSICQQISTIESSYVLDLRRPEQEGQWLLIELHLNDPTQMPAIAERFGIALKSFSEWQRTYIRLAEQTTV